VNASVANAGTVYVYLVVDPPTTAGAGIPAIAGGGQNMIVNSTRSGPGSWHLYAIDDADGSAGIRSFFVKLTGTISSVSNRSPLANWDNDPNYGDGNVQSPVGFDSLRTAAPDLGGSQSPTNTPQISGFGIEASNFQAKTGAASYQSAPISGQWGNYADPGTSGVEAATGHARHALFLAEGLYSGPRPGIDITTPFAQGTGFILWNATGFPNSGVFIVAAGTSQTLVSIIIPEPATLTLIGLAVLGFGGLARRLRG
jgi:hypothetical protein